MKNLLILTLFIGFFVQPILGQIDNPILKGNFMVGGIIRFDQKSTEVVHDNIATSTKSSTLELTPDFADNIKFIN